MSSIATQSQLAVVGTNDIHLTKDPTFQLFRPNYKTYTPSASTFHLHRPDGDVSGLPGEKVSFSLRRTGDLLTKLFLRFRGPILRNIYPTTTQATVLGATTLASTTDYRYQYLWGPLSYYAIDSVEMKLNSTTIDTLYGDWMYVWSEFLQPTADRAEMKTMATKMSVPDKTEDSCRNEYFYLPIPFWFSKHPGLALPLVSLTNTEIQIIVSFARTTNRIPVLDSNVQADSTLNTTALQSIELMTEEKTLCQAERDWFATTPQSYLITQHNQREEYPFTLSNTSVNGVDSYAPNATTRVPSVADQNTELSLENFRLPIKQLWLGLGGYQCSPTAGSGPNSVSFLNDNRLVSGAFYTQSWIMNDSRELTEKAVMRERSNLPHYQDGKHVGLSSSMKKRFLGIAGDSQNTLVNQPSLFSFSMGLDDVHPEGAINFSRLKSPRMVLQGAKLAPFPRAFRGRFEKVDSNYVVLAENYNVLDVKDGTAYVRYTD